VTETGIEPCNLSITRLKPFIKMNRNLPMNVETIYQNERKIIQARSVSRKRDGVTDVKDMRVG